MHALSSPFYFHSQALSRNLRSTLDFIKMVLIMAVSAFFTTNEVVNFSNIKKNEILE